MLDLALTPDQKQLVETVRDFCSREFAPRIAADDRAVRHDPEIFAKLASIGLPGVCFPQRYGGHGLDYLSLGLVCEELEYVDTVYRTVLSVHVGLVGCGIYTWGTEEQKQRWLGPMARGEKIGCFGLTEPDFGSNPGGMACRARKTSEGYVLNGTKMWIGNATFCDVAVVWAKVLGEETAGNKPVIRGFLIERKTT